MGLFARFVCLRGDITANDLGRSIRDLLQARNVAEATDPAAAERILLIAPAGDGWPRHQREIVVIGRRAAADTGQSARCQAARTGGGSKPRGACDRRACVVYRVEPSALSGCERISHPKSDRQPWLLDASKGSHGPRHRAVPPRSWAAAEPRDFVRPPRELCALIFQKPQRCHFLLWQFVECFQGF